MYILVVLNYFYTCLNVVASMNCWQHGDVLAVLRFHAHQLTLMHDDFGSAFTKFGLLHLDWHTLAIRTSSTARPCVVVKKVGEECRWWIIVIHVERVTVLHVRLKETGDEVVRTTFVGLFHHTLARIQLKVGAVGIPWIAYLKTILNCYLLVYVLLYHTRHYYL